VIDLKLEAIIERSLPVSVRFGGKLSFGYKVGSVKVTPETIKVRGPANEVEGMISVDTQLFDLQDLKEELTRELRLAGPGKLLSISRDRVKVSVSLEEELITKEFKTVQIEARGFSGRYRVTPSRVYLRLSGPKRVLYPLEVGEDQVYLDLNGLKPGRHTLKLSLSLPSGVKVEMQKPARFKVRILDSKRR